MILQICRIMLVEDENIIAMDIQHSLETLGYRVVAQVTSGTDAIRTAAETTIMHEESGSNWLFATGWTLAGIIALVVGTIILIPVIDPLLKTIFSLFPD